MVCRIRITQGRVYMRERQVRAQHTFASYLSVLKRAPAAGRGRGGWRQWAAAPPLLPFSALTGWAGGKTRKDNGLETEFRLLL